MNKGLLYGLGVALLAGVGYGIYKSIDKHIKNELEKGFEEIKDNTQTHKEFKTSTEEYVDELLEEEKELEEYEENETKKSVNEQNMFTDDVSKSSEFEALNKIREASGKEPLKVNEQFEKFLGKDSESKSMKESLDNIAEGIKKDPKLKKKILGILQE